MQTHDSQSNANFCSLNARHLYSVKLERNERFKMSQPAIRHRESKIYYEFSNTLRMPKIRQKLKVTASKNLKRPGCNEKKIVTDEGKYIRRERQST
jgi:hypothetical protein